MEQGMKKIVMIVIVAVCVVAAIAITLSSSEKDAGVEGIQRGTAIWLKCRNPNCEHTWQMDKRDYFDYLKEQKAVMGLTVPAIACPKCGEDSGYRAEKCEKCGTIFELNSVPNDLQDRCPECGFSKMEDTRLKARGERK